jgi:Photosynthesis system II assembly factor YCF48
MKGNIKVYLKKHIVLAILMLLITVSTSFAQQYGWVNISNNLPNSTGTVTLPDMYWINDNEGWICSGINGEIYHTTDGGQSFTTQTTQYSTYSIYMLSSTEGYAGGLNGRVYRTTNGGDTWSVIGSIGGTLLSISFPPSSTIGYCCGYSGKIYSITSTGVSSMASGVSSNLKSISFPGSQGWTCGESVILHYNGSWLGDQSYPTETYNAIYMINNTTGWAVGDNGVITKTIDGTNWNYQSNPDTSNRTINNVFFLNSTEGWSVCDNGVILHSTNGGILWTIEGTGMTSNMLTTVQFTSSTNGYALGNNKTLLKYTLTTGIKENGQIPASFNLEQNYPNPFDSETKISYSLAIPAQVQLTVCNMFGQQVALLDEGFKPAGSFSADFKGDGLPSGIYYYRLQCGDRHETRKMTLIK